MNRFELEVEILMLLATRYELTGLEIMRLLNKKLGKNWLGLDKVGFGNLYPALRRLEVAGDITREMRVVNDNPYRRAYYKITYKGGNRITEFNFSNVVLGI